MKKNEEIIVNIDDMDLNGHGLTHLSGNIIKVRGAIKGQKAKVKIKKIKGEEIEADVVEVLERSPLEHSDVCKHFGKCGGCAYLNINYEDQLKLKEDYVKKLLDEAGIKDFEFLGIVRSPDAFLYRNKMEYTFGKDDNGISQLGLHVKGRFYDIVTTEDCRIVDSDFITCLKNVLRYVEEHGLPHYNIKTHEGYLRHLVVRKAANTGEVIINVVTTSQIKHDFSKLVDELRSIKLNGKLIGILHTVNDSYSDAVKCEKLTVLYGRDYIMDEILGLKFKISAFSFFQTNSKGAEKLYSIAREFAGEISNKILFDLYCGTGTIGIIMAPLAKKVIGVELVEEAVDAARENARLNGLSNIQFIAGDVAQKIKEINEKPDVVVLDPPRPGVNPKAILDIIKLNPEKIIYVSCNPVSLTRDLKMFNERQYKVEKVKCVDMFPHTPHVECVTLMSRV
ncbi:RNA methyltransferase, TrmA family [Thermoanaerobacterium thermosaccharolyticum DSM 571]|uniref:RNA methyltransferase, TrmA family n=1 Tax=Thermoanaerobacterium thermosaccharolyticum (strain ATCC 7956 / DSM 571 / NCIMB 9385 / NCA 3814 / NCTC 13789 / WDCM 00135 / 2032) TaxID=580327 RepID=D9TM19_THETC|nr:23S rRNA (uracil(1939)-C(5))-methyltransferase RlmD [Thermoanaerobacterium thermosaccharolyticum]ADL68399.1 RNA methyltransferase, TrmA family [Thermoanaerobacterium thermosaccharolyticum DSM 571]